MQYFCATCHINTFTQKNEIDFVLRKTRKVPLWKIFHENWYIVSISFSMAIARTNLIKMHSHEIDFVSCCSLGVVSAWRLRPSRPPAGIVFAPFAGGLGGTGAKGWSFPSHNSWQSSSDAKLFKFPSHPVYIKFSHLAVTPLKKYRGRWPLQFPSTFSILQASLLRTSGLFGGVGGNGRSADDDVGLGGSGTVLPGVVASSSFLSLSGWASSAEIRTF